MRKIITILIGLCAFFIVNAQSTQVATLFHNGDLKIFYTGQALVQAYEEAVDGDIITMSSGLFNAVNIEKNITIRGAGMGLTPAGDNVAPTVISGYFYINCPKSETYNLNLEGLQHNQTIKIVRADRLNVMKCNFNSIESESANNNTVMPEWVDFTFLHSQIKNIPNNSPRPQTCSMNLINCVVTNKFATSVSDKASYSFTNCVIDFGHNTLNNCSVNNSILLNGIAIYSDSSINKCIIVNCNDYKAVREGNKFMIAGESPFKSEGYFVLTDDLITFTGTDGLQIGIHGGSLPFDPVLQIPRVSKFNVSSKTTTDGKLSVEIEIED